MAETVYKGLIGEEDLELWGSGESSTFTRRGQDGNNITMTRLHAGTFFHKDTNGYYTTDDVASILDEIVGWFRKIHSNDGQLSSRVVRVDKNGNGYTDIATAISNLPANGGKIFIAEGQYDITSPITLSNPSIELCGAGEDTIINCSVNINGINAVSQSNLIIRNLSLSGYSGGSGIGINIAGGSNCIIENVWLDTFDNAIAISGGSTGTKIAKCHFGTLTGSNQWAIQINAANYNTIMNNSFTSTGANSGVHVVTGVGNKIIGNYFNGISGSNGAVYLAGAARYSKIAHNTMVSCTEGINTVSGTNEIEIICNTIDSSTNDGITISDDDAHVLGNLIRGSGGHGIHVLTSVDRSMIAKNKCLNSAATYYGIYIAGTNTYNSIIGNQCYDNQGSKTQTGGIFLHANSSNNLVTHNMCYDNATSSSNINDQSSGNNKISHNITEV